MIGVPFNKNKKKGIRLENPITQSETTTPESAATEVKTPSPEALASSQVEAAHAEGILLNDKVSEAQAALAETNSIANKMNLDAAKQEASGTAETEEAKAERMRQAIEVWEKEHQERLAKEAENDRRLLDALDSLFPKPAKSKEQDSAAESLQP